MSEWATRRLADVVRLRRGHDLPARARRPGSVPVVSSGATEGWHDTAIANGPGVVLGRATNIGRPKWVNGPYWPHNTTLYVEDFLGNEPRWVFHLFETLDLGGYNSGSVQPMLNRNFIADIQVAVPDADEQRRIAAVLGAFDDLIETNRALAASLEEWQRADFLGQAGGQMAKLGEVAEVTMGQSPPGSTYNEDGIGTTFYQGVRDFGWRFPAPRVWTTAPTRLAEEGDVLVAVRAPVGEANIATETTALGRGVAGVRASGGRQSTLFQSLTADESIWDVHQGTGTVFASIKKKGMSELTIPWVEDDALEARLSTCDAAVRGLHDEVTALTRTRDELLPLLMSGRVRVEDVEGLH